MVTPRTYDAVNGFSSDPPKQRIPEGVSVKSLYKVRLTSDDWTSECDFHLTPAMRDLLLEVAAAFNAKATFAVDVRVFVDPADSAAPQAKD